MVTLCTHCQKRNARGSDICGVCRANRTRYKRYSSPWASRGVADGIAGKRSEGVKDNESGD
jgi:hypothetical protein